MSVQDRHLMQRACTALYRTDLFAFVWKAFDTLHSGARSKFVPGWHIKAMCHALDTTRVGTNKRLVINMPPRHLKSITVSVAFTAFLLGHRPETKIMVASYGRDLSQKHAEDCRRVMESPWYQALFPQARLTRRRTTKSQLTTTQGGGLRAVSIGSAVTGHGADYIIIDDLIKPADVLPEAEMETALNFISATLLSRFDKPSEGRVIMVAQRLHEHDPATFLLDKGTYAHLNLPAIAEEEETVPIGAGHVHVHQIGEALCPEHMNIDALEQLRKEIGNVTFSCQYQQNPTADGASVLRWDWFGVYEEVLPRHRYQRVVQSWDTGESADPKADCSVCTTWGYLDGNWHLLDVYRARLDYPDLREKALSMQKDWDAETVVIEKASTGWPLLQDCRLVDRSVFLRYTPSESKEIRFGSACTVVKDKRVFLPGHAPWLSEFKRELLSFPRGRHDDQVDSFSQFLNWSKTNICRTRLPKQDRVLQRHERYF